MKENFNEFHSEQLKRFGARVRQIRKYRKLSQVDIEVATGIYISEMSKIENGLQNFEFITLAKLAYVLNVDIQELFNYEGKLPEN